MKTPDNHTTIIDSDTLREISRINEFLDRVSNLEPVDKPFTPNPNLNTEGINRSAEHLTSQLENAYKEAIRETDWNETPILRIIERHPDPAMTTEYSTESDMDIFSVRGPTIEIKRYRDGAPPESSHADSTGLVGIRTITKPLLDRLAEVYPELLDEVVV